MAKSSDHSLSPHFTKTKSLIKLTLIKLILMKNLLIAIGLLSLVGCSQAPVPSEPVTEMPPEILGKTSAEWIAWHNQQVGEDSDIFCEERGADFEQVALFDISPETEILQITCNMYAYQADFVFYAHQKSDNDAEPNLERLSFDEFVNGQRQTGERLIGANLDTETQQLTTLVKGRGVGDCGSTSTYQWEDDTFVLIEARAKETCDGDIEVPWPVIYQREGSLESVPSAETAITDWMSCVQAGMPTVIIGQNETSLCTSPDGEEFTLQIPGIWANMDITSETQFMACAMGGMPIDRTDPAKPVCFMADGRAISASVGDGIDPS